MGTYSSLHQFITKSSPTHVYSMPESQLRVLALHNTDIAGARAAVIHLGPLLRYIGPAGLPWLAT